MYTVARPRRRWISQRGSLIGCRSRWPASNLSGALLVVQATRRTTAAAASIEASRTSVRLSGMESSWSARARSLTASPSDACMWVVKAAEKNRSRALASGDRRDRMTERVDFGCDRPLTSARTGPRCAGGLARMAKNRFGDRDRLVGPARQPEQVDVQSGRHLLHGIVHFQRWQPGDGVEGASRYHHSSRPGWPRPAETPRAR